MKAYYNQAFRLFKKGIKLYFSCNPFILKTHYHFFKLIYTLFVARFLN